MSSSITPFDIQPDVVVAERYRIVKQIGRGASGSVFLAKDIVLGESELAIKVFHPNLVNSPDIQQALQSAVIATRQLSHPNIVRVFDFESLEQSALFISMEYVPGWNLQAFLDGRSDHPLPYHIALQFFLDIARALSHAHSKSVVHGNLKPENILLSKAGDIKLSDFAVSQALEQEHGLTLTGESAANPLFMAPEQFLREELSPETDVYGLGSLGHQLFYGKPPASDGGFMDLARTHIGGLTEALEKKQQNIPPWTAELLESCLQRKRESRPSSANEIVSRIRKAVGEERPRVTVKELKKHLAQTPWTSQQKTRMRWCVFIFAASCIGLTWTLAENTSRYMLAPYYLKAESFLGADLQWLRRTMFFVEEPLNNPEALLVQAQRMGLDHGMSVGLLALLQAGANIRSLNKDEIAVFNLKIISIPDPTLVRRYGEHIPFSLIDNAGQTLLHIAAIPPTLKHLSVVLAQEKRFDIRDKSGYAPFHLAVLNHRIDAIKIFLRQPRFFVDQRTRLGKTPLMLAASEFDDPNAARDTVRLLLSYKPQLEARDNHGKTVLHFAAISQLPNVFLDLLKAGAPVSAVDQFGKTAGDYAKENDCLEILEMLSRGANSKKARGR